MKKHLLVVGLFIAVIGISLVSANNQPQLVTAEDKTIAYATNSWSLTANLTGGDTVKVIMYKNAFWEQGYFEPEDDYGNPGAFLYVSIGITPVNPAGNRTVFLLLLNYATMNIPGSGSQKRLVNWNISVLEEGSINTSSMRNDLGRFRAVGGTIPFNGTYTANVFNMFPPRNSTYAPSWLSFSHNETVTVYPYTSFLPIGGTVTAIGGIVSVVGVATGKNQTSSRRRKLEKIKARARHI